VLRIDYCSRRLVPRLEALGYQVTYREFDGPHVVSRAAAPRVEVFHSSLGVVFRLSLMGSVW